jgi:hypothetical protein
MMKCTVIVGLTIRVMTLGVSVFMASCSGDEPTDTEITHAVKDVEEPPYTVVEWYPRPKNLPQTIQPYEVYPYGQQPLMPQPSATANQTWQAGPPPGTRQPARPAPGYVFRDIPSDGSWGRTYEPQQPGSANTQYAYPRQQYMPRPWGETPTVGARDSKPASPAVPQGGTVQHGTWQPSYPGSPGVVYDFGPPGGYPGTGYPGHIW